MRRSLYLGVGGGRISTCILLVSEALPFLGGGGEGQNIHMYFTSQCGAPFAWGGRGRISTCILLVSVALPLLGGGGEGQNIHMYFTSQCGAPFAWGVGQNVHVLYSQ